MLRGTPLSRKESLLIVSMLIIRTLMVDRYGGPRPSQRRSHPTNRRIRLLYFLPAAGGRVALNAEITRQATISS
jgi:hypothetical protein